MTLEVSLTPEAESRLKARAVEAGMQPAELAGAIIERAVRRPTLEEIGSPAFQESLNSGMTDDELGEVLEQSKHAMRAAKRGAHRP